MSGFLKNARWAFGLLWQGWFQYFQEHGCKISLKRHPEILIAEKKVSMLPLQYFNKHKTNHITPIRNKINRGKKINHSIRMC